MGKLSRKLGFPTDQPRRLSFPQGTGWHRPRALAQNPAVIRGNSLSYATREFDRRLDRLFEHRTDWLRSLTRKMKPGAPPTFNKKKVERTIKKLKELTAEALISSGTLKELDSFWTVKKQWHAKKGKGWGANAKRRAFKAWYQRHITYRNCVYVFWRIRRGKKRICLYVGRTLNGHGRPSSHFKKKWFRRATRLDIYGSQVKRAVPAFECRMTHQHRPRYSKIKPSVRKYYSRCEICVAQRRVRNEVKKIFSLR